MERKLSDDEWVVRFEALFILWGPVVDPSSAVQRMGVDRSEMRKGVK